MKASHFSKDIQEFFKILSEYRVKYVIVGGEAVIYYGHARLTGDVDFFFEAASENVLRLHNALKEFWAGDIPGLKSAEELMEAGTVLQFGVPPNRIDLMNRIDGVSFEEAWGDKREVNIEISGALVPVYFIGLEELIRNKETIGRSKDLDDLKYLRKARGQFVYT
ncbi:MAG TPA: nucleotidyltransferase [Thermodesulfobacteriota bacterium]|nr:nucleotidyltransferase [Thermodesulfobacteriota bacterium]